MAKKIIKSDQLPAVNYVLRGSANDKDRPALHQTIHTEEGRIEACNGFAAHFASVVLKDSDDQPMEGTFVVDKQKLAEPYDGSYPDLFVLIPRLTPIFSIVIDPSLLKDALPDSGKYVKGCTLEFYGQDAPFLVRGALKDDTEIMALVMPMHRNRAEDSSFDPCDIIENRKSSALTILRGNHPWTYERDPEVMQGAVGEAWWKSDGAKCWFVFRENGSETWKAFYVRGDNPRCIPNEEEYTAFQNTSLEALIDAFIPFIDGHQAGIF